MLVKELKSGIYIIKNNKNNNFYIGSAKNLTKRKNHHLHYLRNDKHPNIHLQRAFNKYLESSFDFSIIEKCDLDLLIKKEQFYIDSLKPQYNICKIAGSSLGRTATKETIIKMKLSHSKRNCNHSEATKIKMRTTALRIKNNPSREAIEKSAENNKIPILQYNKQGEFIEEYDCIKRASEKYNNPSIYSVLTGKRKTASGYIWKYKNK